LADISIKKTGPRQMRGRRAAEISAAHRTQFMSACISVIRPFLIWYHHFAIPARQGVRAMQNGDTKLRSASGSLPEMIARPPGLVKVAIDGC
jgi:hypothetical protein